MSSEHTTPNPSSSGFVVAGIAGARQNAAVAVCVDGELRAFCEQERMTRVRRQGLTPGMLPTEALDAALGAAGRIPRGAVQQFATAESSVQLPTNLSVVEVEHHLAHAATAYLLSPFSTAAALVCDRHANRHTSVWLASGRALTDQHWPDSAQGFASLYADCSALFGLPAGQEHELEALARLDVGLDADRFHDVIAYRDGRLEVAPRWRAVVSEWLTGDRTDALSHRARVASAFQRHVGGLLLAFAADIRQRTGAARLCLGGGLFYNTYFTTILRQSSIFDDVFVAPNPGNAGTAIGAALHVAARDIPSSAKQISPFLGPSYSSEYIKATLDNCKLSYDSLNEGEIVDLTADAIARGQLVAWFQGRMEWAHRALGNRSILANPVSPYVLENLNIFLKQRQRHRAYGVSIPAEHAARFFNGPPASHFMEYEYRPADPDLFRHVMPAGTQAIRVQTVPDRADPASGRFRLLHEAVGKITGAPVVVNTSFNGFSEPMVCSPRDAIRVFFGSGLDLLVLDRFVIRK